MSLEVDGRPGDVPILHQREEENLMYLNGQRIYGSASNAQDPYSACGNAEGHEQPQQRLEAKDLGQEGRMRVRLEFMFRWSFWLALVSVLAVVAAGVAGSIAARRGKQIDTCMNTLQKINERLNAKDSSYSNSSRGTENSTSTTNTTCENTDSASFIPTSDCTSLASPYTPPKGLLGASTSNDSFNIHCGTDYVNKSVDFMSFLAFTFEDCIMGCANYNQRVPTLHPNSTCYVVTFDVGVRENQGPNCFLKGAQNLIPSSSPGGSDSALLVTHQ